MVDKHLPCIVREMKLTGIRSSSSDLADGAAVTTAALFFLVFSLSPNETTSDYKHAKEEKPHHC